MATAMKEKIYCLRCNDEIEEWEALDKNADGECTCCFECAYTDHLERMEPR